MHVAGFQRDDVLAPAQGILGFALMTAAHDPAQVRFVHLADGAQPLRLEVTATHRVVLAAPEATSHLRRMLPRLRGGHLALRALRRSCRPRFAGLDTLQSADLPIRAGKDLLLPMPGVGYLFTGWLLDPETGVERVLLKSDEGFYARLDQRWVRRPRPDVSDGFAAQPAVHGPDLDDRSHARLHRAGGVRGAAYKPRAALPRTGPLGRQLSVLAA